MGMETKYINYCCREKEHEKAQANVNVVLVTKERLVMNVQMVILKK